MPKWTILRVQMVDLGMESVNLHRNNGIFLLGKSANFGSRIALLLAIPAVVGFDFEQGATQRL